MGQCKKDVTPLLTRWSYVFLALAHRSYDLMQPNVHTMTVPLNLHRRQHEIDERRRQQLDELDQMAGAMTAEEQAWQAAEKQRWQQDRQRWEQQARQLQQPQMEVSRGNLSSSSCYTLVHKFWKINSWAAIVICKWSVQFTGVEVSAYPVCLFNS